MGYWIMAPPGAKNPTFRIELTMRGEGAVVAVGQMRQRRFRNDGTSMEVWAPMAGCTVELDDGCTREMRSFGSFESPDGRWDADERVVRSLYAQTWAEMFARLAKDCDVPANRTELVWFVEDE